MTIQSHIKAKPVRITGLGAVTPFGDTVEHFWESIVVGKDAFKPITLFSVKDHRTQIASEIGKSDFYTPSRVETDILSRADSMALAAAEEALKQACLLDPATKNVFYPERTGIIVGTAAGGILGLEQFFRNRKQKQLVGSARSLLSSFCLSSIATNIAREFSIKGQRMTMATVCSSSGLALAAAKEIMEAGELDYVLVVGAESLSEVTHAGFNILRSVAPEYCQPFDANRKGLVLGEGAGHWLQARHIRKAIGIHRTGPGAQGPGRRGIQEMRGLLHQGGELHRRPPDTDVRDGPLLQHQFQGGPYRAPDHRSRAAYLGGCPEQDNRFRGCRRWVWSPVLPCREKEELP